MKLLFFLCCVYMKDLKNWINCFFNICILIEKKYFISIFNKNLVDLDMKIIIMILKLSLFIYYFNV